MPSQMLATLIDLAASGTNSKALSVPTFPLKADAALLWFALRRFPLVLRAQSFPGLALTSRTIPDQVLPPQRAFPLLRRHLMMKPCRCLAHVAAMLTCLCKAVDQPHLQCLAASRRQTFLPRCIRGGHGKGACSALSAFPPPCRPRPPPSSLNPYFLLFTCAIPTMDSLHGKSHQHWWRHRWWHHWQRAAQAKSSATSALNLPAVPRKDARHMLGLT